MYTPCPELDNLQTLTRLDSNMDYLKIYIIEAARKAECITKRTFRPKKYWYSDMSRVRDTKHF
jgi:hypothetical protein